jgi:hypothetical protein
VGDGVGAGPVTLTLTVAVPPAPDVTVMAVVHPVAAPTVNAPTREFPFASTLWPAIVSGATAAQLGFALTAA